MREATTPLRFTCKGGYCDKTASCESANSCLYKSSAEEAREKLDVVHRLDRMEEILHDLEARVLDLEVRFK